MTYFDLVALDLLSVSYYLFFSVVFILFDLGRELKRGSCWLLSVCKYVHTYDNIYVRIWIQDLESDPRVAGDAWLNDYVQGGGEEGQSASSSSVCLL